MELLLVFGVLAAVVIVLLWRSRRNTTSWRESPNAWHRDDTNVMRLANTKVDASNRDQVDDRLVTGLQPPPRVSREEGHGKDGGG